MIDGINRRNVELVVFDRNPRGHGEVRGNDFDRFRKPVLVLIPNSMNPSSATTTGIEYALVIQSQLSGILDLCVNADLEARGQGELLQR